MHLEELRRRGMAFPGSYMSLAETYLATGQPDKAREALTSYVATHPDSSAGLENLGLLRAQRRPDGRGARGLRQGRGARAHRDAEDREGPRRRPRDARRVVRGRGLRQAPDAARTTGASAGRAARRSRWPASTGATSARRAASRPRASRPAHSAYERVGAGSSGPGSSRTSAATARRSPRPSRSIAEKDAEPKL